MLRSKRATVSVPTSMPSFCSCSATLPGVRRVHLRPLIGSPAVSCFRSRLISAMILGVFFRLICALRLCAALVVNVPRHRHRAVLGALWQRCEGQGRAIPRRTDLRQNLAQSVARCAPRKRWTPPLRQRRSTAPNHPCGMVGVTGGGWPSRSTSVVTTGTPRSSAPSTSIPTVSRIRK